ncbi:MAG: hypothetical protein ACOH2I_00315 [Pseudomonas sp.]
MQINAVSSGLSTLQSGQLRVDQAAGDIARASLPATPPAAGINPPAADSAAAMVAGRPEAQELTSSLVALNVGKTEAQLGVKLVQTADQVLGTLFDTRA